MNSCMQILGYITFFLKECPRLRSILFRLEGQPAIVNTYCGIFILCIYERCTKICTRFESRELNRRPRHFWGLKIFLKYLLQKTIGCQPLNSCSWYTVHPTGQPSQYFAQATSWTIRFQFWAGAEVSLISAAIRLARGSASLLSQGYWGLFPRGKVVGAWSWPVTSF